MGKDQYFIGGTPYAEADLFFGGRSTHDKKEHPPASLRSASPLFHRGDSLRRSGVYLGPTDLKTAQKKAGPLWAPPGVL